MPAFRSVLLLPPVTVLLLWTQHDYHVVQAAFTSISLGGSSTNTSNMWACALADDNNIHCFQPFAAEKASLQSQGRLAGNYSGISVSGSGSAGYVTACAVQSNTGQIDCWVPNDETTPYHATGYLSPHLQFDEPYIEVSVGGSPSGNTLAACAIRDGGIDCFNPISLPGENNFYEIMGTLYGNYSAVSVGGNLGDAAKTNGYACTTLENTAHARCFEPHTAFGERSVLKGVIQVGAYKNMSLHGGSAPAYTFGCAIRANRTAVDCFQPNTIEPRNNTYSTTGSFLGSYKHLSMAGSATSSSYVRGCGLRKSGIDCFEPSVVRPGISVNYNLTGSIVGTYYQLAMGGSFSRGISYACAIRESGHAIDCFNPFEYSEPKRKYRIQASYFAQTLQPSKSVLNNQGVSARRKQRKHTKRNIGGATPSHHSNILLHNTNNDSEQTNDPYFEPTAHSGDSEQQPAINQKAVRDLPLESESSVESLQRNTGGATASGHSNILLHNTKSNSEQTMESSPSFASISTEGSHVVPAGQTKSSGHGNILLHNTNSISEQAMESVESTLSFASISNRGSPVVPAREKNTNNQRVSARRKPRNQTIRTQRNSRGATASGRRNIFLHSTNSISQQRTDSYFVPAVQPGNSKQQLANGQEVVRRIPLESTVISASSFASTSDRGSPVDPAGGRQLNGQRGSIGTKQRNQKRRRREQTRGARAPAHSNILLHSTNSNSEPIKDPHFAPTEQSTNSAEHVEINQQAVRKLPMESTFESTTSSTWTDSRGSNVDSVVAGMSNNHRVSARIKQRNRNMRIRRNTRGATATDHSNILLHQSQATDPIQSMLRGERQSSSSWESSGGKKAEISVETSDRTEAELGPTSNPDSSIGRKGFLDDFFTGLATTAAQTWSLGVTSTMGAVVGAGSVLAILCATGSICVNNLQSSTVTTSGIVTINLVGAPEDSDITGENGLIEQLNAFYTVTIAEALGGTATTSNTVNAFGGKVGVEVDSTPVEFISFEISEYTSTLDTIARATINRRNNNNCRQTIDYKASSVLRGTASSFYDPQVIDIAIQTADEQVLLVDYIRQAGSENSVYRSAESVTTQSTTTGSPTIAPTVTGATMSPTFTGQTVPPTVSGATNVPTVSVASPAPTFTPFAPIPTSTFAPTTTPVARLVKSVDIASKISLTYNSGSPGDVDRDLTREEYVELARLLDEFYTEGFESSYLSNGFLSYTTSVTDREYTLGGTPDIVMNFHAVTVFLPWFIVRENEVLLIMEGLNYQVFLEDYLLQKPSSNQLSKVLSVAFAASTSLFVTTNSDVSAVPADVDQGGAESSLSPNGVSNKVKEEAEPSLSPSTMPDKMNSITETTAPAVDVMSPKAPPISRPALILSTSSESSESTSFPPSMSTLEPSPAPSIGDPVQESTFAPTLQDPLETVTSHPTQGPTDQEPMLAFSPFPSFKSFPYPTTQNQPSHPSISPTPETKAPSDPSIPPTYQASSWSSKHEMNPMLTTESFLNPSTLLQTILPTREPSPEPAPASTTTPTLATTLDPSTTSTLQAGSSESFSNPTSQPTLLPTLDPTTDPALESTFDPTLDHSTFPTPKVDQRPTQDAMSSSGMALLPSTNSEPKQKEKLAPDKALASPESTLISAIDATTTPTFVPTENPLQEMSHAPAFPDLTTLPTTVPTFSDPVVTTPETAQATSGKFNTALTPELAAEGAMTSGREGTPKVSAGRGKSIEPGSGSTTSNNIFSSHAVPSMQSELLSLGIQKKVGQFGRKSSDKQQGTKRSQARARALKGS